MFNRMLFGGAAAGALATAFLVGSVSLGSVFAQTTPAPSSATQPAPRPGAPAATETGEQADTGNETSEAAAPASQAKVTADQARAAALAKVPGATIGKVELDNENGAVVYSVKLVDSAGTGQEVKIDATSGTVLSTQADGPETPGAPEGPDTAD